MTIPFRTYSHDDAEDVRRKMSAMLRPGLRCHTGVYNDACTLGLVIANPTTKVSRLYEFGITGRTEDSPGTTGPALTDLGLLTIVSEWASGDPRPPVIFGMTPAAPTRGPVMRQVFSRDEFTGWFRDNRPGATCLYHRGSIANFRKDAPLRIIELQRLHDAARPSSPRPPGEAIEIQQLQDALELIGIVSQMAEDNLVAVTQRREIDGEGYIYLATKRGR